MGRDNSKSRAAKVLSSVLLLVHARSLERFLFPFLTPAAGANILVIGVGGALLVCVFACHGYHPCLKRVLSS